MKLNDKVKNLQLLQEECAELIMACSKIRRFGLCDINPLDPDKKSNRDNLITELADVLVFIEAIVEDCDIENSEILKAKVSKKKRLETWY